MDYQSAMQRLLKQIEPSSSHYLNILTLQSRLDDNMKRESLFGSTEAIRAERAEIIHAINNIAITVIGISFNELALNKLEESRQSNYHGPLAPPATENQVKLRDALLAGFSLEEMKTLCFDLGVDWEDFPGNTATTRAQELITYMIRRGRLSELIAAVRKARPGSY
jgi:hypothetical protein